MTTTDAHILRNFAWLLKTEVDDRAIKRLDADMSRIGKGFRRLHTAAARTTALLAVGIGAAAAGLAHIVVSTAREGDAAAKTAAQLNVQVEAYQELIHAGRLAGASSEQMQIALKTLGRNAEAAARGTGEAVAALQGIALQDGGQMRALPDLLDDIADKMATATDQNKVLADAQRIFGESGATLIPLLRQGSAGIAEMRAEIRGLGAVMSEQATKQAERFQDQMLRLQTVSKGLRNEIGTALMPVVSDLTDDILAWVRANRELLRTRLQDFADRVGEGLRQLGRTVQAIDALVTTRLGGWTLIMTGLGATMAALLGAPALGGVVSALGTIVSGLAGVLGLVLGVSSAFAGLGIVLVGGAVVVTLGQLAAVIGITAAVFDDLLTHMRGGDSVFGRFLAWLRETGPLGRSYARYLDEVVGLTGDLGTMLDAMLTNSGDRFLRWLIEVRDLALLGASALRGLTGIDLGHGLRQVLDTASTVVASGRQGAQALTIAQRSDLATRMQSDGRRRVAQAMTAQAMASSQATVNHITQNVEVAVQAGRNPSETGSEVGYAVGRELRDLQADLATGLP